jgi:hypothetical protein
MEKEWQHVFFVVGDPHHRQLPHFARQLIWILDRYSMLLHESQRNRTLCWIPFSSPAIVPWAVETGVGPPPPMGSILVRI